MRSGFGGAIIVTVAMATAGWAGEEPAAGAAVLPEDVIEQLLEQSSQTSARYFAAEVDLDAKGPLELVVHLVGGGWCGTGGCTTFVFRAEGDRHVEVDRIPLSRPPIRVGARSSSGWRTLIVGVGGGGVAYGDLQLSYDGATYGSPARQPADDELASAALLIDRFDSWSEGRELALPKR